MDTSKVITQAEFARRTGIDPGDLKRRIARKTILAEKTADGLDLIPISEVDRLATQGRPPESG